jgi:hypothetical protein
MTSDSRGKEKPSFNPELYEPSPEVQGALAETLDVLMQDPHSTIPIGRRLFGTQHYLTSGWFHDEEMDRLVEVKAHWLEWGRIANFFLNPHRPRVSVRSVSIAHIQPIECDDDSIRGGPYRLFFFNAPCNRIDTCAYDDYEADASAVQGLGDSQMMREQLEAARQSGDDVLTPQLENQLIDSLNLGNKIGWQAH